MGIEFEIKEIPFVSQPKIQLEYKGRLLEQFFRPDFVCFDKIIVEIKAVSRLIDEHKSQVLNYLNATNFELAFLVNFGGYTKIEYQRLANSKFGKNIRDEVNSWM